MWRKIKQELDSIRGKLIFFFLLSILFIGGVTWQCQKHLLFVSIKSEEEECKQSGWADYGSDGG